MAVKVFGWPGSRHGALLANELGVKPATLEIHRFPDGESLVSLPADVGGDEVVFAVPLDRPDAKLLPLLFAADAARELGAKRVILAAPYLPYMRQDTRFHPREAITSRTFARLVSGSFDALVTVDPHLHRFPSLASIYPIETRVVHAAPAIARWIAANVNAPVIVGPDAESEQWVMEVARLAGARHAVMQKERRGDRDVRVQLPEGFAQAHGTPVLVDDIVSSGRTLLAAASALQAAGWPRAVAIGVHTLADEAAVDAFRAAGIARFASCDTVQHATNAIPVMAPLADAVREVLR